MTPAVFRSIFIAASLLTGASAPVLAQDSAKTDLNVVVSIPPIHSLVAKVMGDLGQPKLLLNGGVSPHSYALKPSNAADLQSADLVVWVGPNLERFLERPLENLATSATSLALQDAPGLHTLLVREYEEFTAQEHEGEHDHEDEGHHDEHEGEGHHDEEHEEHEHEEHAHEDEHEEHAHENEHEEHAHEDEHEDEHGHHHEIGSADPHIWLDPDNAIPMVRAIAHALADLDSRNAETYMENAEIAAVEIAALSAQAEAQLDGIAHAQFITFHDGYQYFEDRFELNNIGVVTLQADVPPSAAHLSELKETLAEHHVTCLFAEPQFTPRVLNVIAEGTDAKIGTLDPLGAGLTPGADLYDQLIGNMVSALTGCLAN